jgi:signal transduction histidine kinase
MLVTLLTVALIAILALGLHVLSAAPGRPENRAFAAFSWMMALWILNDLVFWGFAAPDEDGTGWGKAAFLIALGMQMAFLRFAWLYPEPRAMERRVVAAILAPLVVVVPVILTGRVLGDVGFRGGVFRIEFTPWTYVVGGYVYLLFGLGRVRLATVRRATGDARARREIDLALGGPTITGLLTTLAIVALPLLGIYVFLPYAAIGILAGTIVHAYAVLRFRFLAPASVLDRVRLFPVTAKLAIAIVGASVLTVLIVLAIARPPSPTRALVFGLIGASVPAMGLIAVAQRILTRPLRRISEAAIEVAGGRTGVRVAPGAQDEVGVLATAFNDMVERLERDLQALRDMSEGLLRTERLATAGALAAGIAHEVNNPLAAVSSLVQTARGRVEDPRAKELLEDAIHEMERIATAMRDLMELARPRPAARRRCEANAIVEAALRILRYDRRFKGVPIEAGLGAGLPPLEADPDRLQQVVLNLLLNARDAIEGVPGGALAVATTVDGDQVAIEVRDTGRGIAKEDLSRVCEPFFTTKAPGAGTGLGLAVCRDIVREHDGRIAIESEPGKGTRVRILLPAHAGEAVRA